MILLTPNENVSIHNSNRYNQYSFTVSEIMSYVSSRGYNAFFLDPYYSNGAYWIMMCNVTIDNGNLYLLDFNPNADTDRMGFYGETSGYNRPICAASASSFEEVSMSRSWTYETYQDRFYFTITDYLSDMHGLEFCFYTSETYSNVYINNVPLITHEWTSVAAISGDMGILSLAQITDEGIGDGVSYQGNVDISNILRFTDQSNLRILVQNLTNDIEQSIIQAGHNSLTATVHHNSATSYSVTLKFYLKQGEGNLQTETMIFSTSITMVYNNQIITYLSFIIDYENGAARFDPINLVNQPGTTYHNTVEYNMIAHTDTEMAALYTWLMSSDDLDDDESPYDTGTEDDGGDGFPAQPQDHIGLSNLPTLGGLNLGLVTLYSPTDTQLTQLAQFLWDSSTIEDFKKYFNNFADNLLGLYVLPYKATQLASKNLIVGGMDSGITGVEYITVRFVDIDMGSFEITPRWKSYLSFAPYTKIDIYLPYCGTHSLDTDEVMCPADSDGYLTKSLGSTLKLNYRLDLCTGNIVATLFINNEARYQFTGKCGHNIPLTGQSYTNLVTGGIQAAAGLATTILSGGMTAPLSLNAAVTGTIMAQKPEVYRSGNLSGDVSSLGYDTPYLIKTTPNKPKLENQQYYTGFPSYKKSNLGSFSGYTEVIEAHIDTISCTSEERDMIMAALKGGVII